MKIEFPQANKVYVQKNRSNIFVESNIWSSMSLDFQSNVGAMRVSPRLLVNTLGNGSFPGFGVPVAFKYFDSNMWAIAGLNIYKNPSSFATNGFVQDGSASVPGNFGINSDMETIGGYLVSTTTDHIWKKVSNGTGGGAFTSFDTLISGANHKVTYFRKFDRLYVLDNNSFVYSTDNSLASLTKSGDYTLTLANPGGDKYYGTCLKSTSTALWIGAISLVTDDKANRGSIFEWDGISAQPTNQYFIDAHAIYSIVIKDNIPFVMDSMGRLLKYSGSSFDEVGRLPVQSNKLLINSGQAATGAFIDANGMVVTKNNTILANVNGLNEDGTQNENFASGVYEFDLNGGCTHKYPFTYDYVISPSVTDFGQNRILAAGAMANVSGLLFDAVGNTGTILVGATYYTDATTTISSIFVDNFADNIQKKGYFVTTFMESDEIAEGWTRLWSSFRRFLNSTDNIVFKYRNYEVAPLEATITWTSTLTFTTGTDITAYAPTATDFNGTTGGEVEIIQGTGGAVCAHITNISLNAGTYTVTIDEVATGVTNGTAKARFQKWVKLNPAVPLDQIRSWAQFGIDTNSTPRIQYKGCFTYTGEGEFYKAIMVSNSDIKIKL